MFQAPQPAGPQPSSTHTLRRLADTCTAKRARASSRTRPWALSAAAVRTFGDGGRHFDSHAALAQALRADLRARAPVAVAGGAGHALRVLVKGSRGSAMDRIVSALLAQGDTTDAA